MLPSVFYIFFFSFYIDVVNEWLHFTTVWSSQRKRFKRLQRVGNRGKNLGGCGSVLRALLVPFIQDYNITRR